MLENKVILVTGSAAGIGYATAKLCLSKGAKVMIHGRDPVRVEAAAKKLGTEAGFVVADLGEKSSPQIIIKAVLEKFGRIDGLVNNAARLDRTTIENLNDDLFDEMMHVNVRAPLMLIQAALPHMQSAPPAASIVNIGSVNAHCGAPNLLVYSASKSAMMAATRNLGDALGPHRVRINQLNVGWTLTENEHKLQLSEGHDENWLDEVPATFAPSGTLLMPDQIAEHVVFWLSDQSAPVSGQVYEVEQYPLIGRNRISER
jgi:NAD(P)-dependent dehydrogenase (short-subunit alcohol dehydrogenase family)